MANMEGITAMQQIDMLADWLVKNYPEKIEGSAVETAVKVMTEYKEREREVSKAAPPLQTLREPYFQYDIDYDFIQGMSIDGLVALSNYCKDEYSRRLSISMVDEENSKYINRLQSLENSCRQELNSRIFSGEMVR